MPDDNPYASPSESDPTPEPILMSSTVAKIRLIFLAIVILGVFTIVYGAWYEIRFAGIPAQDPTPKMRQEYRESHQIASFIMSTGFYIFLPSIIIFVGFLFVKGKPK